MQEGIWSTASHTCPILEWLIESWAQLSQLCNVHLEYLNRRENPTQELSCLKQSSLCPVYFISDSCLPKSIKSYLMPL